MPDFVRTEKNNQSLAEEREELRLKVFFAKDVWAALNALGAASRDGVDTEFAINGMPRAALPWRFQTDDYQCEAEILSAAYHLGKEVGKDGAHLLADSLWRCNIKTLDEALCVAEDEHLIVANFYDRFGEPDPEVLF